jgi:hypothetical protein
VQYVHGVGHSLEVQVLPEGLDDVADDGAVGVPEHQAAASRVLRNYKSRGADTKELEEEGNEKKAGTKRLEFEQK